MVKFDPPPKELLSEKNIKFLILKHTGEEILAYVLQNDKESDLPEFYYIFSPVRITNMMNPQTGALQYLMSEYISARVSSDVGFELRADDVLIVADVEIRMLKTYAKFCQRLSVLKIQDTGEDDIILNVEEEKTEPLDELTQDEEEFMDQLARTIHPLKKDTLH